MEWRQVGILDQRPPYFIICLFKRPVCVYARTRMLAHTVACMYKSEDNFEESVLFPPLVLGIKLKWSSMTVSTLLTELSHWPGVLFCFVETGPHGAIQVCLELIYVVQAGFDFIALLPLTSHVLGAFMLLNE